MPKPPKKSQKRHKAPPPRRQSPFFAITVVALIAIFVAVFLLIPKPAKPIDLVQGSTVGQQVYPPGDTSKGGHGQAVDGIPCDATAVPLVAHYHAHLAIFVDGKQVAVPYGIGIVPPLQVSQGFVDSGSCLYWMHTHDATGIIHVETPAARAFTLGQFFAIWGRPLSATDLLGHSGKLQVYVNGRAYSGNPARIVLTDHQEITLELGGHVQPPSYAWPQGL